MKIKLVQSEKEGGQVGLAVFRQAIEKGATVFGLATGSSPISIYDALAASNLDFSTATSINLDEYIGLAESNPQSYRYFMQKHLFSKKTFAHSYLPNGQAKDISAELLAYNQLIARNPIDLQLLGLGQNGHIGFNEPGTSFESETHIVNLTENTIRANSRFFSSEDQVPKQAISMGIASIMRSKEILIAVYGQKKAQAVKDFIQGPITEMLPASILQKHANVTVILDPAAASLLDKTAANQQLNEN